ncbi:Fur family transcriptional regulator [Yinghuangia seranimata]|uniref:Fur family transcriptional regulator n=1 Tax=Yinghuangia seranimata TaxID=408067 RepID=UPI00248BE8DF|nr:transcriptional repressor [Yinghuangia seranimata]MDI2131759.1 transcriptional repressor [Yinghuangia seranimata]
MTIDWKRELRDKGYRLTPQRQLVLEAVDTLGHATPDEILTEIHKTASGINISTVYRTLELLEQLDLVKHTHLGHGAPTYHPAGSSDHLHLVCRDCERVTEVELGLAEPLAETVESRFGFDIDLRHFAIFGRCGDCTAARAAADGADGTSATPAAPPSAAPGT